MRSPAEPLTSFRVGPFVIDGRSREIRRDGRRVLLSETEFGILYQIVERRGALVLRDDFTACADRGFSDRRHPVDTHVSQIRKKMGDSIIVTEPGKGYRLSSAFGVERASEPSSSELEKQLSIALDQINDHSAASLRGVIQNCEELLKANKPADAYAVLALAYVNQGHVGFCREIASVAFAKARKIIDEALREFPEFGTAYALRGLVTLISEYDWKTAEIDLKRSLELSPQSEFGHGFISHLYVAQGRFDEGLEHARIAASLDYQGPMTVITEPWLMNFAGRVDEAVDLAERVAKRFAQVAPVHSILGHCYLAVGADGKAIKCYERALEIEFLPETHAALGFIRARQGKRKEALKHLDAIEIAKKTGKIAYVSSYFKALVYAGFGSRKKALDALERAFEEKCDWLIHLAVEPRWKILHCERRFHNLLRKVGIQKAHWIRSPHP